MSIPLQLLPQDEARFIDIEWSAFHRRWSQSAILEGKLPLIEKSFSRVSPPAGCERSQSASTARRRLLTRKTQLKVLHPKLRSDFVCNQMEEAIHRQTPAELHEEHFGPGLQTPTAPAPENSLHLAAESGLLDFCMGLAHSQIPPRVRDVVTLLMNPVGDLFLEFAGLVDVKISHFGLYEGLSGNQEGLNAVVLPNLKKAWKSEPLPEVASVYLRKAGINHFQLAVSSSSLSGRLKQNFLKNLRCHVGNVEMTIAFAGVALDENHGLSVPEFDLDYLINIDTSLHRVLPRRRYCILSVEGEPHEKDSKLVQYRILKSQYERDAKRLTDELKWRYEKSCKDVEKATKAEMKPCRTSLEQEGQ